MFFQNGFHIFAWRVLDLNLDFCHARTGVWTQRYCIKLVVHQSLNSNASASISMICDCFVFNCLIFAAPEKGPKFEICSRLSLGTPVERPRAFVKPAPQSGDMCWFLEISISIIIELRSCMVLAQSARLRARGGGGRMHVVRDGLKRGFGRCVVNYNTWGLTHLVRTRCVVNYNTWGLTHLVTGLCFESSLRTLDETGVFPERFPYFAW